MPIPNILFKDNSNFYDTYMEISWVPIDDDEKDWFEDEHFTRLIRSNLIHLLLPDLDTPFLPDKRSGLFGTFIKANISDDLVQELILLIMTLLERPVETFLLFQASTCGHNGILTVQDFTLMMIRTALMS